MSNSEKHSEIYHLAGLKLSGEITPEGQKRLNELISSSEENKKIYEQVEKVWHRSQPNISVDVNAAWSNILEKIVENETPVISIVPSRRWRYMSVAASIVLAFGIFFLYRIQQVETIDFVAVNAEQVQLVDGTQIEVNSGSSISYPDKFKGSTREVNLKGEAFFRVARDESKPFIIHTPSIDVKVLGTSFFVNTKDNGDVEVLVKTGKVQVTEIGNDTNEVILVANENILFKKINHTFHVVKLEANKLYWQTKTLIFKRTTLKEVVQILNMNYDKQVVLANQQMENCKLTATFKDKSFEEIMEVIKATFNASVKQDGDKIIIDGENCE